MVFFIRLILLFTIAILIAVLAQVNVGNVVLFYPPYRIDLSLNLFVLLLSAVFLLLFWVLRFIQMMRRIPQQVATYKQHKCEDHANHALREALKAFFEGRFGHAEKYAQKALQLPENVGPATAIAAYSAHQLGQYGRRDVWLSQLTPHSHYKMLRLVATLQLLIESHETELALEAANELMINGARHIHVLRLALKANQQMKRWPVVLHLVKLLDKHGGIQPTLSKHLRELAYQTLLKGEHDVASLKETWQQVSLVDQTNPVVATVAVRAMLDLSLLHEARIVIENTLKQEWSSKLIAFYRNAAGSVGSAALLNQIERCEMWLKEHPRDAELLLTMGILCLYQKLWGKAEKHLEEALLYATEPMCQREINLQLAQLNESLGKEDKAKAYYRACAHVTPILK